MLYTKQNEWDCTIACISIVSHIPLEEIYTRFPKYKDIKGTTLKECCTLLDLLEIHYILYQYPTLYPGKVYIITVPSLNYTGGNHTIAVEVLEDNTFNVYDPNRDYEGRIDYTPETLRCWSEAIEIVGIYG